MLEKCCPTSVILKAYSKSKPTRFYSTPLIPLPVTFSVHLHFFPQFIISLCSSHPHPTFYHPHPSYPNPPPLPHYLVTPTPVNPFQLPTPLCYPSFPPLYLNYTHPRVTNPCHLHPFPVTTPPPPKKKLQSRKMRNLDTNAKTCLFLDSADICSFIFGKHRSKNSLDSTVSRWFCNHVALFCH